jgi:outer membrane immunogenic protein
MNRFIIAAIAASCAICFTQTALAADLPRKAPAVAPTPVAAPYDWSGLYVGGNIGGAWTEEDRFYPQAIGGPLGASTNFDRAFGGFNAGAQVQWQNWLLGVEVAYSAAISGTDGGLTPLPTPPFAADTAAREKLNNLLTVGPRLGFAWDRWLFFVTGGYAVANLNAEYAFASTGLPRFPGFWGASRNNGWFAGGGFDVVVYQGPFADLILGAEYQHVDLKEENIFCFNAGCSPANAEDYRNKANVDIVRARITLKSHGFGWFR